MVDNKSYEINYFESELFKILLYNNKFKDKFNINLENNKITIQRIDDNIGWGQDLQIIIRDKILHTDEIIKVGNSNENIKQINFDVKKSNKSGVNHFENNSYKIFYISKLFNDIFKIKYNEQTKELSVKRIDSNEGWGQDLKLKYIEKKGKKEKIINIGKSNTNEIKLKIDINTIKYTNVHNYYESDNFIITLFENKHSDLFSINFYEDNNTIYIKRIDADEGWGQPLMLNIYDIKKNKNFIIYIGSSITNEIYKKIDLNIRKCYIALTTIPSRIKLPIFMENIKDILKKQTYEIEHIFITIAKKYKRFTEKISDDIINLLKNIPKVILITLDEDLGPASKYLGPLMNYHETIKNNILVVIDDDRKYNKNLLRNFSIGYNSFPNITFSSGLWGEYFNKKYATMKDEFLEFQMYKELNNNKFHFGQGLGGFFGFAIKVDNMQRFIDYNIKILNRIPKSVYHDEGIILGYLKYKEEIILYLKHKGCNIIDEELTDALCTSNLVNRGNIEKEILQITNLEMLV